MYRFIVVDAEGRIRGGIEYRLVKQVKAAERLAKRKGWTLLSA